MLSEEMQDFIADERYGIPIRRSSALKTIDMNDPRDALFAREMGQISGVYNLNTPELAELVCTGIERMLALGLDINSETARLADSARLWLDIRAYSSGK
jgi:hypothetical protein